MWLLLSFLFWVCVPSASANQTTVEWSSATLSQNRSSLAATSVDEIVFLQEESMALQVLCQPLCLTEWTSTTAPPSPGLLQLSLKAITF